jgi:hypothetical protein
LRLLEKHDYDFDSVRAFLVTSMVFLHAFEQFYIKTFNGNFTSCVLIGFVLLSGFVVGVKHTDYMNHRPSFYFAKYFKGSFKLFVLFFLCNLSIMVLLPERFGKLLLLSPDQILRDILLGQRHDIFGFEVLIPIAYTMIITCVLLALVRDKWVFPLAMCVFVLLGFMEKVNMGIMDSYNIKLLLVGFIGGCVGKIVNPQDWDNLMEKFYKGNALTILSVLVLLYYLYLILFTDEGAGAYITFFVPVLPTMTILLLIYMTSKKIKINCLRPVRLITLPLSKNMLFAYLFHILLINSMFLVVNKHSQSALSCVFIGIFVLIVTVLMCWGIEYSAKRLIFFDKIYSTLFR